MTTSYAVAAVAFGWGTPAALYAASRALGRSERFTRTIDALETCPECQGHGVIVTNPSRSPAYADRDCHLCHGKGTASREDIEAFAQYVESMSA